MNYRHAYHAGNFADVMKHMLLVWIVGYLQRKPKSIVAIDTHAGAGLYHLGGLEAGKTQEWRDGIGRLLAAPDIPSEAAVYMALLRDFLPDRYPGSPVLIEKLLRPLDRLIACELHPEDAKSLADALPKRQLRIRVMAMDGYAALHALPPPEKRGLVLIDPPYEAPDEFDRVVRALKDAHRRFATATYALWYPIKGGFGTEAFLAELTQTGIARLATAELRVRREDGTRLSGSGLAVVNPPFGFEQAARGILDWLAQKLGQDESAVASVRHLLGD